MRYVMLIQQDETIVANLSQDEQVELKRAFGAFYNEMRERGVSFTSEALLPSMMAKTVIAGGNRPLATDGPFAATKEQVGGVFIVDCADWDEAIEIANKLPVAKGSAVEIRPILQF